MHIRCAWNCHTVTLFCTAAAGGHPGRSPNKAFSVDRFCRLRICGHAIFFCISYADGSCGSSLGPIVLSFSPRAARVVAGAAEPLLARSGLPSQLPGSHANGDGHKCVPNKNRADFPPVLESDHTMAVCRGSPANVGRTANFGPRIRWREPPPGKPNPHPLASCQADGDQANISEWLTRAEAAKK